MCGCSDRPQCIHVTWFMERSCKTRRKNEIVSALYTNNIMQFVYLKK